MTPQLFPDLRITPADRARFTPFLRNWLKLQELFLIVELSPRQLQVLIELEMRRPSPRPMILTRLIGRYAKTLKATLYARIRTRS